MADLTVRADRSTEAERRAVDAVITADDHAVVRETERLVRGGHRRRASRRHLLLPALHALQAEIGWISPGGLDHVCDLLQVPPAEAYGVATFYELFRTDDPGHAEAVHHVCVDPACAVAGSAALLDRLRDEGLHTHPSPCLGQCERAPATFVQGRGEPDHVPADADAAAAGDAGVRRSLRLLERVGVVDPTSLDAYRRHGGYEALRVAIDIGPDAVIDAVREAGLVGRGGAAFPTAVKWRGVADQPDGSKHVIADADESEPGTFKDRVVMEGDPFAVIESLTLAGLTVGAEHGWIYIRGEYPLATERLRGAVDAARAAGLLGGDVLGSGRSFDVEIRRGAGAYICGEETALMESIEGFRGEPRNKPPFPTTHGLFGEPTVVNNPETLLNALHVVRHGAADFRSLGTDDSPGTRLFCLAGHVARPGLYEFELGTTLREAIDAAGGARGTLAAVLMGGAAGSFLGPDRLDMPLTHEGAREHGTTLGSGVITLFDDTVDFTALVVRIARFFRDESCGQCVPCRVGTVRQHEVLVELQESAGPLAPQRRELIDDMARAMGDASICGLGHTASGAVQSAIRLGLIGGAA